MSLNHGQRSGRLIAALVLGVMSSACRPGTPEEPGRVSAVIEYLIDTNGMGHFEPSTVYCVAASERGGDASEEVLDGVRRNGLQVLAASECTYDQSIDSVVVTEERTPAVLIWAREASDSEMKQFTREAWRNLLANASMMRGGFYTGQTASAAYFCLVTNTQDPDVIQCDLGSIS